MSSNRHESTRITIGGTETLLAFLLGFGSLMPKLSQQIYPLDISNIARLIAKLWLYHPTGGLEEGIRGIKETVNAFHRRTTDGYWPDYWNYTKAYLKYNHDCIPDVDYYNFSINLAPYAVNGYQLPKELKKALNDLQVLVEKWSMPYLQNNFYTLGKQLATCYDVMQDPEIQYPEYLTFYYLS